MNKLFLMISVLFLFCGAARTEEITVPESEGKGYVFLMGKPKVVTGYVDGYIESLPILPQLGYPRDASL